MTQKEAKRRLQEQALDHLREQLKPGQTVYTLVRSVSRSGMQRQIRVFVVHEGKMLNLDCHISKALGIACRDGLVVEGCGMDVGYHTVYRLGKALWPDGTLEPHGTRNGAPDSCGGYALKHEWI